MTNPNESVRVWNRACGAPSGPYVPREGDRVLAAMIRFDSRAHSGGVLHAVESLGERGGVGGQSARRAGDG